MLTIFTNPDYDFIGRRRWAYAVSVALMLLALGSIVVKGGLQYDIDFTGGTLIEVRMSQAVSVGTIRARLAAVGLGHSLIQEFGDSRDFLIRTQVAATNLAELSQRIRAALALDQARRRFDGWRSWVPRSGTTSDSKLCMPSSPRLAESSSISGCASTSEGAWPRS